MPQIPGDDHERQRARHQPVEHVPGVVMEHEDARERDDPRHDRGGDGAATEVLDHVLLLQPPGVPHQVDRGQVCADGDREHTTEDRRGVDPAAPRVARGAVRRHASGRDGAGDRTHAVGHQHRRRRERRAEVPLARGTGHLLAEGEARAAQHDAERGERERDEQRERDRRERLREPGPQHDQAEDEPDVVRLPHRPDRVADDLPGRAAPPAPPAVRSQNPPPKSAPPKSAYAVTPVIRMTATTSLMTLPAHGRRPVHAGHALARLVGAAAARSSSPCRHRRLISRSTSTSETPTTA